MVPKGDNQAFKNLVKPSLVIFLCYFYFMFKCIIAWIILSIINRGYLSIYSIGTIFYQLNEVSYNWAYQFLPFKKRKTKKIEKNDNICIKQLLFSKIKMNYFLIFVILFCFSYASNKYPYNWFCMRDRIP